MTQRVDWHTGHAWREGDGLRRRFTMSRQDELLKLAELFFLQANLTQDRAAKRSLRKMGNSYRHEAERLREEPPPDSAAGRPSDKHSLRHRAA